MRDEERGIPERNQVDFFRLITDAGVYTKDVFLGKRTRWIFFIISTYLLYPLFLGYTVEIYRGKSPSTSENLYEFIEDEPLWGALFIDGIKALIIKLLYVTPIAIILAPFIIRFFFGEDDLLTTVGAGVLGLSDQTVIVIGVLAGLFIFLYTLIIGFSLPIGLARFARTKKMREAFRFVAIFQHIGRIGWINYLLAIGIFVLAIWIFQYLLVQIPIIGLYLLFIFTPVFAVFSARYFTLVYECVPQ